MNGKITYKDAGVDVEMADRVIASLADRIKATFRPEVIGKMGGFAAAFQPDNLEIDLYEAEYYRKQHSGKASDK